MSLIIAVFMEKVFEKEYNLEKLGLSLRQICSITLLKFKQIKTIKSNKKQSKRYKKYISSNKSIQNSRRRKFGRLELELVKKAKYSGTLLGEINLLIMLSK